MKIKNHFLLGISGTVGTLIFLFLMKKMVAPVSCAGLSVFDGGAGIVSTIKFLGQFAGMYTIGLIGYFIFNTRLGFNITLYFSIVTLTAAYPVAQGIGNDLLSEDAFSVIKASICNKVRDNGITCELHDLSRQEYEYFTEKHDWIPKCPESTQEVSINYYRDDFLGDYRLDVSIIISQENELDSLIYPDWNFVERLATGLLSYSHQQGSN